MSNQKDKGMSSYEINHAYVLFYVVTMAITGVCVAYTTGGNNQVANIFAAKMDWSADETRLNNTIINTVS